ncbi:MAG: hypothetical protein ABFD45_03880 [Smithella sp.]
MKETMKSRRILVDYYKAAKESFIDKMKSEDDERSNLKFKIAAFVLYELSHSAPPWFKSHFLTHMAKDGDHSEIVNENILKTENVFYDVIADYLIKMESEVDYVKKILAPFPDEWDKKEFWKPIVFDAFLIVGIYFTPLMESHLHHDDQEMMEKQAGRNVSPRYLYHTIIQSPSSF